MHKVVIEIITSPIDILKCLLESKLSGKMIGITSKELGDGTVITAVKDIVLSDDSNPVIIIKGYDMSGYFLERDRIEFKSITSVIPFNSIFENPFAKGLKKELAHFKNQKDSLTAPDFFNN